MEFLKKIIYSKNIWTICVAAVIVWLALSGMGAMLSSPEESSKIFLYILEVVLISFLGATIIVKIIIKVINSRFSFEDFDADPSWIFILALGSLFFSLLFGFPHFFAFDFFAGIFLLSFVPAGLFRIFINFLISFLPSSNKSRISIVNGIAE